MTIDEAASQGFASVRTGKAPSCTICNSELLTDAFNVGIRLAKEAGHTLVSTKISRSQPKVEESLQDAHSLIAEMLDCVLSGKGDWHRLEQRAVSLINA